MPSGATQIWDLPCPNAETDGEGDKGGELLDVSYNDACIPYGMSEATGNVREWPDERRGGDLVSLLMCFSMLLRVEASPIEQRAKLD